MEKVRSYFHRISDIRLAIVITLILVFVGVFLGHGFYNTVASAPSPGFHYLLEPHNPLSYLASWDGADYIQIALTGYQNLFWVNWFPLYPITIHVLNFIIPSPLVSALVIAWTSLVGAIYFYLKIARKLFNLKDVTEPLRALLFFVLFPTSVFLIAPFAESLFAFLALGAIYFALSKRYYLASLFALLSSATHITGVIVAIFVALIMLEEELEWYKVVLSLAVSSLGLLSYML
ncbi:MAG: mannosyltransferase family protein, partial [Candidatus Saccharimonadia bacterium]